MDTASLAVFIDEFYEQTEHAMDNLGVLLTGWLGDSAAMRPAQVPVRANGETRDVRSAD
jgi:hypothetical protein